MLNAKAAGASILEFVTKPMANRSEITTAFTELNGIINRINGVTDGMKKRGKLSRIGAYVGPLRTLEESYLDLTSMNGAMQINMGIDTRGLTDAVNDLFVNDNMENKGSDKFNAAMTEASTKAIRITDELFRKNNYIYNKSNAQGFKGIEGVILAMMMYIECGKVADTKSTFKNALAPLPKTSLRDIKEIALTRKEEEVWDEDKIWTEVLKQAGVAETDELIPGHSGYNRKVRVVKENLGSRTPLIVGKPLEWDFIGPKRQSSDKAPKGKTNKRRAGGIYELRTIQNIKMPRTKWQAVTKEYLDKSEEWNNKED